MRHVTALSVLLTGLSLASTPAGADLFQRQSDGTMWKYDGNGKCAANACPGWILIDRNLATQDIAAGFGGLYQLHKGGQIWRYDGSGNCAGSACPGWTLINHDRRTTAIAGGPGGFYQRQVDGKIWKYDGHGQCTTNQCPGWTLIDMTPSTRDIVAANGTVFQRYVDGKIWKYDGQGKCTANACPGWTLIDLTQATQAIAGASGRFYQRHSNGSTWKYDGNGRCSGNDCPGWDLIDTGAATRTIAAGGGALYQMHGDRRLWTYDGRGKCSGAACPGWDLIDKSPQTREISADQKMLFQRYADGRIWKYDGRIHCRESDISCPGWTLIDNNRAVLSVSILAVESGASPTLGDLVAGSPVSGIQLVRDLDGFAVVNENAFFTSPRLCDLVLNPAPGITRLEEIIKIRIGNMLGQKPFKMRSDSSASLSTGCNARAELKATGNNDIHISINLPQNGFSLFLTTPNLGILGLGVPGEFDPHLNITFDIKIDATITIPPVSGPPLQTQAGGLVSNVLIVRKNVTAEALDVVNDVQKFFTGDDFFKGVTNDIKLDDGDFGDFLDRFNSRLNGFPPGVAFVSSYDRGSGTLVLRSVR